ncbi:MAG: response regulator [Aeromicrobium sp.]|nr:response regulator [Burkholderiales bacterium]
MAVSDDFDLDFTSLLDPMNVVPEPAPTPEQEAAMNDEAIIGESKLTSNGFFVRLFPDAPRRAPASAPPTILVVEDDEVTSALLERMLLKAGYKVLVATNRAGIVVGMKAKPDLVILDVLLPDANGFDILNRIRSSSSLRTLPVLMLSSLGALEDIMKGLKMGANGYLTKPAKSKALLNAIEEVMFK